MSYSDRDRVYLLHIRNASMSIMEYTLDLSEEQFMQNHLVQDAVVRNLEVIGEAAKKVSVETRKLYPGVEWRRMSGMRDKLIHDYMDVDYEIVWETIMREIPKLLEHFDDLN